MEVHGEQEVYELLRKHAPEVAMSDLTMYADLITTRQAWKVPNVFLGHQCERGWEMNLVLDTVVTSQSGLFGCGSSAFRHEVGEIELTKESCWTLRMYPMLAKQKRWMHTWCGLLANTPRSLTVAEMLQGSWKRSLDGNPAIH